jgi:hypothetical protein
MSASTPVEGSTRAEVAEKAKEMLDAGRISREEMMEVLGSTEMSMCAECGAFLDDSRNHVKHMGKAVDRCLACAKHGLCLANPDGPHERIVWPEDPDFDADELQIAPMAPNELRVGYCARCFQEFHGDGQGFQDLTWETVARLWAAESDPALLMVSEVWTEFRQPTFVDASASHRTGAPAGSLWFALTEIDDPTQGYAIWTPPGRFHGVAALLWEQIRRNDQEDPTTLSLGNWERLMGREARLTVNGRGEVVDIEVADCPNCGRIHNWHQGGSCL